LATLIDSAQDPIPLLARDAPEMRLITHVLILGPAPAPTADGLRLVAGNGEASLFAVTRNEISR
jgi:hypothetical protein